MSDERERIPTYTEDEGAAQFRKIETLLHSYAKERGEDGTLTTNQLLTFAMGVVATMQVRIQKLEDALGLNCPNHEMIAVKQFPDRYESPMISACNACGKGRPNA